MSRNRNKANSLCLQCGSKDTIKRGKYGDGIQQFSCLSCGKKFSEKTSLTYKTKEKIKELRVQKVSFYSIEKETGIHRDTAKRYWNELLREINKNPSKMKEIPYAKVRNRKLKSSLTKAVRIYDHIKKNELNYPNLNGHRIGIMDAVEDKISDKELQERTQKAMEFLVKGLSLPKNSQLSRWIQKRRAQKWKFRKEVNLDPKKRQILMEYQYPGK